TTTVSNVRPWAVRERQRSGGTGVDSRVEIRTTRTPARSSTGSIPSNVPDAESTAIVRDGRTGTMTLHPCGRAERERSAFQQSTTQRPADAVRSGHGPGTAAPQAGRPVGGEDLTGHGEGSAPQCRERAERDLAIPSELRGERPLCVDTPVSGRVIDPADGAHERSVVRTGQDGQGSLGRGGQEVR